MKKFSIVLLFFAFVFAACEKDQDMYQVLPVEQVKAPVLTAHDAIVIDEDNLKTSTAFKWQPADFGVPTATEYTLYVSMESGSIEPTYVSSAYGESMEVLLSALNSAVIEAGALVGVENNIQFILAASISSAYSKVVSVPLTVKVTAFSALPAPIHLIGNVLGSKEWNNANYEYVMFRDNNLGVNTYTTRFRPGGFKFISNDNIGTWDDLYGQTGAGVLGNKTGNDITDITAVGYYTVTADINRLTYTITPFDETGKSVYNAIGLIGEFNGWSGDLDLTQTDYDPHIWIVDNAALTVGELKFRANHDWGTNWGATDQFPYGKGLGGGDNIKVPEAGLYFVKLNDLTGHYVFYKK